MTLNEYQLAAARTCPDLGSEKLNISHMIMGMVSELQELDQAIRFIDKVNVGEELTDIQWYLANYCRFYDISYETLLFDEPPLLNSNEQFSALTVDIAALTDLEKKSLAYNKPVTLNQRQDHCWSILLTLRSLYQYFDLDMEKCMENNINKLKVRFPDKFSEENAINRNLWAERAELEK